MSRFHYSNEKKLIFRLQNLSFQKYFVDEKPTWHDDSSKPKSVHTDKSVAQYTGGIVSKEKDLSAVSLGPTPMPELAHLTIGLESVSHQVSNQITILST